MIHYPIPVHKQKAYTEWRNLEFPISEQIHREILSIPISPIMENDEVQTVCETLSRLK